MVLNNIGKELCKGLETLSLLVHTYTLTLRFNHIYLMTETTASLMQVNQVSMED